MPDLTTALIDLANAGDDSLLLGTVKAIDATTNSLTVTLPAGDVSGLRWITSYTPAVNDLVVVERVAGSWLVQGKTSAVMTASTQRSFSKELPISGGGYGAWSYGVSTKYWVWSDGILGQGKETYNIVTGGEVLHAGVAIYSILSLVPSGATITSAKLTIRRNPVVTYGSSLVSPVVYGTNATSTPTGSPPTVSGYGPWKPGRLTYGQSGTWDLPSSWLSAWLAGTLTGIATVSSSSSDFAYWDSAKVSGTYTY